MVTVAFLYLLFFLPSFHAFEKRKSQLGCFSSTETGLLHEINGRGDELAPDLTTCLTQCSNSNFTFAGFAKTRCVCGQYLGSAIRVPISECLKPCSRADCSGSIRLLIFILGRDNVLIEHGAWADSSSSSGVSESQWEMIGVGAVVLMFALSLLIHCVRVSRRRSRLTRLYITSLERGEKGHTRPPGWVSVSNTLCAEFFCCCPVDAEEEDEGEVDLDYQELLHDLDLRYNPKHRKSFTNRVKEYIRHCEKERKMEKAEIERLLRTLHKGENPSTTRSSLLSLARKLGIRESTGTGSRHLPVSACPVHVTRSSLPRLCRTSNGSSPSSLENTFPQNISSLSMYTKSNLPRGSNISAMRRMSNSPHSKMVATIPDGGEVAGSESQCSQLTRASSHRLLPVSQERLREMSRDSRHKRSDHSESARRANRKRSRYVDSDSESYVSET